MSNNIFDIVVVGGGIIGASLACALNYENFHVALIEKKENNFFKNDFNDSRVFAFGYSSVEILKKYQIWQDFSKDDCIPYNELETWELKNSFIKFNSSSIGLSELGFIVNKNKLIKLLWNKLYNKDITTLCAVTINYLIKKNNYWEIILNNGKILLAKLIVGADGIHSQVRKLAGIGTYGWNYQQFCLSIIIECNHLAGNTTWQKFTPNGPRAFLPLHNNNASLILYDNLKNIRQLQSLSFSKLKNEIYKNFPNRLNCNKVKKINFFPLIRHHAHNYVIPGLVLIGDSAHTINPLAGQGVNLGYRDIKELINILVNINCFNDLWKKESILLKYQKLRKFDNNIMQIGMDCFYFLFSNNLPPIKAIRNLALKMLNNNNILKKQILKYAIGL